MVNSLEYWLPDSMLATLSNNRSGKNRNSSDEIQTENRSQNSAGQILFLKARLTEARNREYLKKYGQPVFSNEKLKRG